MEYSIKRPGLVQEDETVIFIIVQGFINVVDYVCQLIDGGIPFPVAGVTPSEMAVALTV